MKDLRRAQDLLSQKSKKAVNLEKTVSDLVNFFLELQDPVRRAQRNGDTAASVPGTRNIGRRYVQAQIKHQVHLRDQGQCTHKTPHGQRCENQRWLEIHHQLPLFFGGTNNPTNLTTLCSAHHKIQHMQN